MKIPKYLEVSKGNLYVDIDEWKKSPQRKREIEHTEQLRRRLQNEQKN